jgi:hypothetical protein
MKILEPVFKSGDGGFSATPLTYRLIKRTDKVAVYSRELNDKIKDYEVFLIKILPKGTQIFQKVTEDDEEKYPSTGQFGRIAWTFSGKFARANALARYENLVKGEEIELEKSNDPEKEEVLPKSNLNFNIPTGEFTIQELADFNKTQYCYASVFIRQAPDKVKLVREERRASRGKPTKIFTKNI